MAFDFPASPAVGQIFGNYKWDGEKWVLASGPSSLAATPSPPQGRLTCTPLTPVVQAPGNVSSSLVYTPYVGNLVPLYDGTNMVPTTFPELSCLNTDTTKNPSAIGASKVNDWFVWNDAGTVRLSHGPDWTNDTTPSAGTALTMVGGFLLNSVAITNGPAAQRGTYVGTTRSNSSGNFPYQFGGAAVGGTPGFFGIWNMYNRVLTGSTVTDTSGAYTYTSQTVRQAHASTGNQINFIVGLAEDAISASGSMMITTAAVASAGGSFGVGLNTTTTYSFAPTGTAAATAAAFTFGSTSAGSAVPQRGFNALTLNENADGTNPLNLDVQGRNSLSIVLRN